MKQLIHRFFGRYTMYQGVLYALVGLFSVALAASVIGELAYSPLSLVMGLASLVLAAIIVNTIFSYIFGKGIRYESALITAFILFFLVAPANTPIGMLESGLVAAFAIASKYLIAFKGKHIFNPAAAGAVMASLVGLSPAIWWVATPILTVPVTVFGIFLLYRVSRLQIGILYIAANIVLLGIAVSFTGDLNVTSFMTFLTSYPIIFLACFMLTEPLTQAPRHYQRLGIALIVAALVNLHFILKSLSITPELALLVGNLVAFAYGQHHAVRLRFVSKRQLGGDQVAYYFEPLTKLRYQAGQYLELTLPHRKPDMRGQRRMFTIAAAPESNQVRIVVRNTRPISSFKNALQHLPKSSMLEATGIYGDFILPIDQRDKLLLIAGGIGITPFLAHLQHLYYKNERRDIVLLYFVTNKSDVVYENELKEAERIGLQYHIVESRPSLQVITDIVGDVSERVAYVSGPPIMVDVVRSLLRKAKVKRVVADQFDGY